MADIGDVGNFYSTNLDIAQQYSTNKGELQRLADQTAITNGVPIDLFRAVIGQESGWNPMARGVNGEIGLGQHTQGFAKDYGLSVTNDANDERWHPTINLFTSAKALREYKDQYGTWENALRVYNRGTGYAQSEKTLQEANNYVDAVMAKFQQTKDRIPSLSAETQEPTIFNKLMDYLGMEPPKANFADLMAVTNPKPVIIPFPQEFSPIDQGEMDLYGAAAMGYPTTKPLPIMEVVEPDIGYRSRTSFEVREEFGGGGRIEELRRVIARGMATASFGVTDLIEKIQKGQVDYPETIAGIAAGGVAQFGGFLLGPYQSAKLITGSRLFPTLDGLRGLSKLMAEGGATLGIAGGLSSLVPALMESKDLTEVGSKFISATGESTLVGSLFPLFGGVPTKALRGAVAAAAMDFIRSEPGRWSSVPDVLEAIRTGHIDSKQMTERVSTYLLDFYLGATVPTMNKQLTAMKFNDFVKESTTLSKSEIEQTILDMAPSLRDAVKFRDEPNFKQIIPEVQTESTVKPELRYSGGPDTTEHLKTVLDDVKVWGGKLKDRLIEGITERGQTGPNLKQWMTETFNPGKLAPETAANIITYMGRRDATQKIHEFLLTKFEDRFDGMTLDEQKVFFAGIKKGISTGDEQTDAFWKQYHTLTDETYKQITDEGAKLTYLENRFAHLWETPSPEVKENIRKFFAGEPYQDLSEQGQPEKPPYQPTGRGKSLIASKRFFKQQVLPDIPTGITLGLIPKEPNLVRTAKLDLAQQTHFLYATRLINAEARGDIVMPREGPTSIPEPTLKPPEPAVAAGKPLTAQERAIERGSRLIYWPKSRQPEGWEEVKTPYAVKWDWVGKTGLDTNLQDWLKLHGEEVGPTVTVKDLFINDNGDILKRSQLTPYSPRDSARILNNWATPGIEGNPVYDGFRKFVDPIRKLGVAFSAFHLELTAMNAISMGEGAKLSDALWNIVTGNPKMAAENLQAGLKALNPLVRLMEAWQTGHKLTEEFYKPGSHPELAAVVQDYMDAGGRFPSADVMKGLGLAMSDTLKEVGKTFNDAKIFGAINKFADLVSEPIMKFFVPLAKAEAFAKLRERSLSNLDAEYLHRPDQLSAEDMLQKEWRYRQEMQTNARHIDNIFGQLAYDNLMFSKTLKDSLFLVINYPGWNIGSFRWLAGMGRGTGQFFTGQELDPEAKKSLEFGLGLITTVTVYNTLMHLVMTGNPPTDAKDILIGPRTGNYLPNGLPERIWLASYWRDLVSVTHNFPQGAIETAFAKSNVGIKMLYDLYRNQDYFGQEITSPEDTYAEQKMDQAKYIGKQFLPFSIRNYLQGVSPYAKYGSFVGISQTPKRVINDELGQFLDRIDRSRFGITLKEDQPTREEKRDILKYVAQGDRDGFYNALIEKYQKGGFSDQKIKNMIINAEEVFKDPQYGPLKNRVRNLPVEVLLKAYQKANHYQKQAIDPILDQKLINKYGQQGATP